MTSTSGIILAISLIIIMFGMGLSLTIADFRRVMTYPKAMVIGLVCQFVTLPLIGYLIATSLDLSSTSAIGIMLLAACPGGPTSNMLTYLAKGDLALSVSLTAVASLLSILTIPFVMQFALAEFSDTDQTVAVNALTMIQQLFVIVIIPVGIGMFVKHRFPTFSKKMERPVKIASAIIFILVVVGGRYRQHKGCVSDLSDGGGPTGHLAEHQYHDPRISFGRLV